MQHLGRKAMALGAILAVGVAGMLIPSAAAAPPAVRLHIGTDGKFFQYGSTTQNLTTAPGSCVINSPETVMKLTSTATGSTTSKPGLVGDDLGVKASSSGSNGSACGQVNYSEALTFSPGSAIVGRTFTRVRLDLEISGNAIVKLVLTGGSNTGTYYLQSGNGITSKESSESDYDRTAPYMATSTPSDATDACAAPNTTASNYSSSDNCQWTVTPGFNFTTATLSTVSCGSVSVEGSDDFGNDPNYDTLFSISNSAPTPATDSITTNEDTAISGNVLANDTDPDTDILSAALVTPPAHGVLNFASTGAYTYTPALNYNGPDSFTYSASDGAIAVNAAANITVRPVNDAPVAVNGTASTTEDNPVTVRVATDVDSTALTTTCSVTGGSYSDLGDGRIVFTPTGNFNGTATASCRTTDDQSASATSEAAINVTVDPVNDPPQAVADTGEVNENASVVLDVVANDTDVDADTLTPVNITDIVPAGATAVVNPDRTVTFTPPADYSGPASFSYQASDGTATSNVASVDITVFPVLCSQQTVTATDVEITGSFTRLTDSFDCKRYALTASTTDDTVLFQPTGDATVTYQGYVSFGPAPLAAPGDPVPLSLRYDPAGGNTFQPVQWCINPQFDGTGKVTTATLPAGETWCIASATAQADVNGDPVPVYQVYGVDDPKFTR